MKEYKCEIKRKFKLEKTINIPKISREDMKRIFLENGGVVGKFLSEVYNFVCEGLGLKCPSLAGGVFYITRILLNLFRYSHCIEKDESVVCFIQDYVYQKIKEEEKEEYKNKEKKLLEKMLLDCYQRPHSGDYVCRIDLDRAYDYITHHTRELVSAMKHVEKEINKVDNKRFKNMIKEAFYIDLDEGIILKKNVGSKVEKDRIDFVFDFEAIVYRAAMLCNREDLCAKICKCLSREGENIYCDGIMVRKKKEELGEFHADVYLDLPKSIAEYLGEDIIEGKEDLLILESLKAKNISTRLLSMFSEDEIYCYIIYVEGFPCNVRYGKAEERCPGVLFEDVNSINVSISMVSTSIQIWNEIKDLIFTRSYRMPIEDNATNLFFYYLPTIYYLPMSEGFPVKFENMLTWVIFDPTDAGFFIHEKINSIKLE